MATLTQEDISFLKWLDSPEQACYWLTNDEGEKIMLREGWSQAEKEYRRIKTIKKILKDDGNKYVDFEKLQDKIEK